MPKRKGLNLTKVTKILESTKNELRQIEKLSIGLTQATKSDFLDAAIESVLLPVKNELKTIISGIPPTIIRKKPEKVLKGLEPQLEIMATLAVGKKKMSLLDKILS